MSEATITLVNPQTALSLFGARDQHLHRIRDTLSVDITHRNGKIYVAGPQDAVTQATAALEQLKGIAERTGSVDATEVAQVLALVTGRNELGPGTGNPIKIVATGREVRPRTPGQIAYVDAIRKHDLIFAVGPAGTGKTYLAVAMAVEAFKNQETRKIVLVRPAVEAGESLGYLPGDLYAKINPYLRPLLDALYEMMDYDLARQLIERDTIEICPLAYMRGRTLNEAFIILDEAQNTTVAQMKMFLTRMGRGSKIVIAGDSTQVDLPSHTRSGFADALYRLKDIDGVCQIRLSKADIVRHRLVQDIVRAYEETPKRRKQ
ncbi:MAG: PhoH family protein [Pirellulaceae bacterium]|nr:PhoH family protein [Planctomycetales bacterium]